MSEWGFRVRGRVLGPRWGYIPLVYKLPSQGKREGKKRHAEDRKRELAGKKRHAEDGKRELAGEKRHAEDGKSRSSIFVILTESARD
jgi:hypothetical protein